MNGSAPSPQVWTPRRLVVVAVIAAALQAGLIYLTSDHSPFYTRPSNPNSLVRFGALAQSEILALTDPTLFARANPNGFSGPAWLTVRPTEQDPEITNAPQWLTLVPGKLGETFRAYVRTNPLALSPSTVRQTPVLTQPSQPAESALAKTSSVQVEGSLAGRQLTYMPSLPAQTNAEILLPSEVQLLVDARGVPISTVLLKSSGSKPADQMAVNLARGAQFAPDRAALNRAKLDPEAGVIAGVMVFRWHTEAAPVSNGTALPNPR